MIVCKQVTKRFSSTTALRQLDLHVRQDTITGLVGKNGAGKTSLLKMIAGYLRPTEGKVEVFGQDPFDNLFVSANSILIDEGMAFPENLVLQELLEHMERFYLDADRRLAERLLTYLNLPLTSYYNHLSKGQKSSFHFIFGLCSRASLTIFDEPTSGMDRAVRQDLYQAMLKDYLQFPRTIVIASHHIDELEVFLEYLILLEQGQVLLSLPIEEFRQYAYSLQGPEKSLRRFAKDKRVLYEKRVGSDELFMVLKKEAELEEGLPDSLIKGIVSPADLAVYLTSEPKGGIDHVFASSNKPD